MTELAAILARGGETAEGAACALRIVSAESRAAALGAGAVLAVLPYMRAGTPPAILTLAVQMFSNLCRHTTDGPVQLELVSPALPLLEVLLHEQDRDVLVSACTAVKNITDGPSERTAAVLAVPGLTARLVALMSREPADVGVQGAALAAVGNMLSGTDSQVDRCFDAGCLEPIMSLLASSEPSLVAHAARATGNVFTHTHAIQRALERDALPRLRDVLASGSGESVKQAAKAVGILCYKGSPAQRGRVVSLGVLEPYCAALARADDSLATLVLAGLEALLQAEERDEAKDDSEDEGKVKSLCMKLGEVGVLDRIQALLQRQVVDEGLRRRALELSTAVGFYVREEDRIFEEGKEFTPAEIVEELQSRELAPRVRAARAARRMLCRARGDGPARLRRLGGMLLAAGGCAHLLAALHDHCSDLQHEAVWALAHIASEKEHITAVVDGEAIPSLVTLLTKEGDNVEIAEQAAVALGHIASRGRETRDAVLAHGGGVVRALLPHLRPETPPARLRNYARTFRSLCDYHGMESVSIALVSPALPCVSQLLGVGDRRVLVLACRALECLMFGGHTEPLQAVPGLTAGLVALLGHEAAAVQGAALGAVRRMLRGTDDQRQLCLDAGCLELVVRLLQSRDPVVVQQALWATHTILRGAETRRQRILEKDILPLLVNTLADGERRCQAQAAEAISLLCYWGSGVDRDCVVSSGALERCGALLAALDTTEATEPPGGLDEPAQELTAAVCRLFQDVMWEGQNDNTHAERIEAVQAVPGLTARLAALAGRGAGEVRTAALLAVRNMLSGSDAQKERCLDAGCLDHLVRLLQGREPALVLGALRAAYYILRGTETQRQRALDKDILTQLHKILEEVDEELKRCRVPAAEALAILCVRGSDEQRARVVVSGVLAPYCELLAGRNDTLICEMLDGLEALLQAAYPGPTAAALRSQLASGVLDRILTLTKYDNREVNNKAARLLTLISDLKT